MSTPLPVIPPRPAAAALPATPAERKPSWLKVRAPGGPAFADVRRLIDELRLNTVCEEAHCPNIGECWEHRAATFMILGDVCTRNCAYCAVAHGTPQPLDDDEPRRLAEAVATMGMRHIVVTSVDRDDLPNGGAAHFARVCEAVRLRLPEALIEVLVPDFQGSDDALRTAMAGGAEAFLASTARSEPKLKDLKIEQAVALEMAVDEQAELEELERRWREAEEIAEIADGLLPDRGVESALHRLKDGSQPNG